jgi:ATP-dependent DNA helicase RecG
MPGGEKKAVMALFTAADGVLVATTVIEVGVDVPNASLMVIEHAERFGLSQLHQLRGRVGRGAAARPACCCTHRRQRPRRETARAAARHGRDHDGFEIARRDLEIRGPASSWARASRARRCCALPTWPPIRTCWSGRANWRRSLLDRHPELARRQTRGALVGGKSDYLKA